MTYFRTIGLGYCVFLVILYSLSECMTLLGNIWLSKWTEDPVIKSVKGTRNSSSNVHEKNIYFIGSYLGFGLGQSILHYITLSSFLFLFDTICIIVFDVPSHMYANTFSIRLCLLLPPFPLKQCLKYL